MRPIYAAIIAALALASPILVGPAFAQGGSDTPRPPGSDPSARVDQLQGRGPAAIGTPGNPTGNSVDRPGNPAPSNATPGQPSARPGNTGMQDSRTIPGTPGAAGRSGTSSPTN